MTTSDDLSRRGLLKAGAALGAGAAVAGLSSCASAGAPKGGATVVSASAGSDSKNPFGMAPSGNGWVLIPSQGFGLKWLDDMAKGFNRKWPEITIKQDSSKDMKLTHQAAFTTGPAPEVVFPTGIDSQALSKQGQISDLTSFFDAPSYDGGKVRDILAPGWELAATISGQKLEALPFTLNMYALWYSKKVFRDNGWTAPKTWNDLLALAPEMVKKGIAPIGYDGIHAGYPANLLWAMVMKQGGAGVFMAIDELKPNAWRHPAVKTAADAIADFRAKGYFMAGSEGLNHTQSQTYWAQGKCAFIPCGGWLEKESSDVIPPDYDMGLIPAPALPGDTMPQTTLMGEPGAQFYVPVKSANPKFGFEFLRYLATKEASQIFTKETMSLTSGKPEWAEEVATTPGLKSQIEALKAAGKNLVTTKYAWYGPTYSDPVSSAVTDLFKGAIKGEEFVNRCQKAADDYAAKPENKPRSRTVG